MVVSSPKSASEDEIPILDAQSIVNNNDITLFAKSVRDACQNMGFFYVTNHGISQITIDSAFEASKKFFSEPLEKKMLVSKDKFHRGYLPIGTTRYPGKAADLKDSFDIGIELPLSHPDVVAGLPLHGPNQWPSINGFREAAESYFGAVKQFGFGLLRVFAKSLELEEEFFINYYQNPTVLMRMLHYPPQAQAQEPGSIGAYPHTDYGVITVLAQDPSGGLELQKKDGSWIAAPYVPGTFVINIGDLMAHWTNGLYQSNKHQVVNRTGKERFSIPFFFNPDHRAIIKSLPNCNQLDSQDVYQPVMAGEYISNKIRRNQGFKN